MPSPLLPVRADAAVSLLLVLFLFFLSTDEALLRAVYNRNGVSQDFEALPSAFGPALPAGGVLGSLREAEPPDACLPVRAAPCPNGSSAAFVALVRRHGCPFATKVLHAEKAGFRAAVVHDAAGHGLVTMTRAKGGAPAAGSAEEVGIPSVFVGASAAAQLKRIFHYDPAAYVVLLPECRWDLPARAASCLPARCRLFGGLHCLLLGFSAVVWVLALYVLCYL